MCYICFFSISLYFLFVNISLYLSSLVLEGHCYSKLVSELVLFSCSFWDGFGKVQNRGLDRRNSFSLWRVKIWALFVQDDLLKVLFGKNKLSEFMSENEKEKIEMKAHCAIQLCLADKVLRDVADKYFILVCGSN